MKMSDRGLAVTMECEGLELQAYPDPGTWQNPKVPKSEWGKPWTIGYGHTKGVVKGMTCTKEQAIQWLKEDIVWAEDKVKELVKVPLTQNQFDALVDFVFNLGEGSLGKSTLLKKLNQADYKGAALEFPKWNRASGKVMGGLVKRRKLEQDLFNM